MLGCLHWARTPLQLCFMKIKALLRHKLVYLSLALGGAELVGSGWLCPFCRWKQQGQGLINWLIVRPSICWSLPGQCCLLMTFMLVWTSQTELLLWSSILAWRIPGMEEPGGLLSMGSHRVRHDWCDAAAAAAATTNLLSLSESSLYYCSPSVSSYSCYQGWSVPGNKGGYSRAWLCSKSIQMPCIDFQLVCSCKAGGKKFIHQAKPTHDSPCFIYHDPLSKNLFTQLKASIFHKSLSQHWNYFPLRSILMYWVYA